jgi:hypothetical protein
MNNPSISGNTSERIARAGFSASALLPARASKRLSLISVWLSVLEQPSKMEAALAAAQGQLLQLRRLTAIPPDTEGECRQQER